MEAFAVLYTEILDEDAEESKDNINEEENECNFFALKELMKLEFSLLTKSEPWFKSMAMFWSNNVESLKQVTNLLRYEGDKGVKLEAIMQL